MRRARLEWLEKRRSDVETVQRRNIKPQRWNPPNIQVEDQEEWCLGEGDLQDTGERAMQTFLPYADFQLSAASLDRKRLGKQRVEAYQILRTLLGVTQGWKNHPAVKMWRGHEAALYRYTLAVCEEWKARGYKDTIAYKIYAWPSILPNREMPKWLGNETFHRSHRANLVAKDPEWYVPRFGKMEWEAYVWPEGEEQ